MADYGYYRKVRRRKDRGAWGGVALKVLDAVMIVFSALCLLLLLSAYLAKYIDPNKSAFFAFPGLMFPVLYIAGLLLTLYWVVRWKIYAVIMAAVLLLGIGNTRLFYKMDLREHYGDNTPGKTEVVVMSYNVMGFHSKYDKDGKSIQEIIGEFVVGNNVDILCLQEFPASREQNGLFGEILSELRYRYLLPYYDDKPEGLALAIYSRYPIVQRGSLEAEGIQVRPIWTDIRIRRDTVRVLNSHLQSTTISGNDVDFLKGRGSAGGVDGEARIKGIARKLRDNYRKRAPQAKDIAGFISRSPYSTVVCSDMNDTPMSYAYRRISRGMQDSFVEKGSGITGTYNGFFNMFRIDYIFMSKDLEVKNYFSYDEVYSDHNPVAASLEFIKK